MRHQRKGRTLGRDSAHRKALFSNLTGSLVEHGRITTTLAKAKEVRPIAEKMVTLGKRGDLHALFTDIAPRFTERQGGYTRIVKLGPRSGDNAEMAILEWVD